MIMPASEAWDFALRDYDGAVVNPGSHSLQLGRDQLEELRRASAAR
jgi:hypothetical protein